MPRPRQADSRRRTLIGAALAEIAASGSAEVTVARIARRAGLSPALAHHYFGAKEDLLLATMRHLLAEFGAEVAVRLKAAGTPRARVSAIIAASFGAEQFHRATISAWLAFYTKALSSAGAARLLAIYHRRLHSNLVHALAPLIGRDRARRTAGVAGALIDGLYLRAGLGAGSGPADAAAAIAAVERLIDDEIRTTAP